MATTTPTFFYRHHLHHHPSSYFIKHQGQSHSHHSMLIPFIQTQPQNPFQPCKSSKHFLGFLNLYLFFHFFCFFAAPLHLGSDQWDPSLPHLAKTGSSVPLTRVASRTLFAGRRTALLHHHHRLQPLLISTTFLQWLLSLAAKVFYVAF